jgi:hypothetical protein
MLYTLLAVFPSLEGELNEEGENKEEEDSESKSGFPK